MVYIYKKVIGKKDYYYLRASSRKNGKQITKDIAYLGSNIEEAKKNFPNIAKNKQEIKKAYRRINLFLEKEYYRNRAKEKKLKKDLFLENSLIDIESCKIHFEKVFKKLDNLTQKEIIENFSIDYTYNTTSLEGNTITLEEAKNFFEENMDMIKAQTGNATVFDDVSNQIKTNLLQQKQQQTVLQFVEDLERKAMIVIYQEKLQ